MKTNNASKPAMPFQEVTSITGGMITGFKNHSGLTKREIFAMTAMQGLLSKYGDEDYELAWRAVGIADSLLRELEKTT